MKQVRCYLALALPVCFGIIGMASAPVMADHGNGQEIRMRIALSGPAIKGITPKGHADFRSRGTRRSLEVEAEKVALPNGTVLTVAVDGSAVGSLSLMAGEGELELDTQKNQVVPAIQAGDVVTVSDAQGNTILSGKF